MAEIIQVQDLIESKPKPIITISADKWYLYFSAPNYYPILRALANGPKTITEIYEGYPQDQDGKKKKAESTINRYVKDLISEGFVKKVGRRLQSNQVSSKILYGRTAHVFARLDSIKELWESNGTVLAESLGIVFKGHFSNKQHSNTKIIKLFKQFDEDLIEPLEELLQRISKVENLEKRNSLDLISTKPIEEQSNLTVDYINLLEGDEGYLFYDRLGLILWLLKPNNATEFLNNLENCFDDNIKNELIHLELNKPVTVTKNQQDLIHFNPARVSFVTDENCQKYFKDINYNAVIYMLREKPMTIKEITAQHFDRVVKHIEKKKYWYEEQDKKLPGDFKVPKKPKVENTIYRYVKELIQSGLVVEAGRRIIEDQPATQILYESNAKIFIFFEATDEFWKYERWKNVTYTIGMALKLYTNKQNFDFEKFHTLVTDFEKGRMKILQQVLEKTSDNSIVQAIKSLDMTTLDSYFELIYLVEWIIGQEDKTSFRTQILECFSS